MWVDGVGARKEKERETERQNARWGESAGEGRGGGPRDSPLSLSARRRQTQAAPVFFTLLFLLLTARREGVRLWGEVLAGWLAAVKMERKKRKESARENLSPKPGDLL